MTDSQQPQISTKPKEEKRRYRAIEFKVLVYIAWKNLWAKKTRSFLTIMGTVIGITAIYFLFSFGIGIQGTVTTKIIGDNSLKAIDVNTANSKLIQLNEEVVNKFKTFPHVEKVGVQYSFPGAVKYQGGEVDSVVYGVNEDYLQLLNLTLKEGRLLKNDDNKTIVINEPMLESIGYSKDKAKELIDKEISITIPLDKADAKQKVIEGEYKIVGVIESTSGNEVFMHESIFGIAGVPNYQQAKVVADDTENIDSIRKQIESNGFQTTSLVDTIAEVNKIFRLFNMALLSLGSVGMVVSVLGMFNTLTISLLERTKEIGLMIALGGRQSDMRKLFIIEAMVISLSGAVVGVVVAFISGNFINAFINNVAKKRGVTEGIDLFATPMWSVLAITLFSMIVGLIVVYFPARRAQRINPIEALRSE